ncbi:Enzyme that catalyzes the fourth step in the histidine pathway [Spiromyces aspiralis]|uniref:Enzyme that catalyzes the fourth step in the histidine pathway n=1 Tax=Spiromyces aspiralis TaxID=68401 RepID=A0ACC1I2H0_9FUNG|nr:Enzyme that catalyzes the fourth step in the histidine pathway [Spiromyces aspiralis]
MAPIAHRPRTLFRPCIDLHQGKVKQIVGGTLQDHSDDGLKTNFVSDAGYYAGLYRIYDLRGAHVIKLGSNNDDAAREALAAWPDQLQVGGGITIDNALEWLDAGAQKVIVTSWLFPNAKFSVDRLIELCDKVGRDRLVVDISCRVRNGGWWVAMNKWQTVTDMEPTSRDSARGSTKR